MFGIAITMMLAGTGQFDGGCEGRARSVVQIGVCQQQAVTREDARLNRVYRRAMRTLPMSERYDLRSDERAWIRERDNNCRSGPTQIDMGCLAEMTRHRAELIERRLDRF